LRGICWLYPDLGYCQGVGVIAAILLLILEEEDAFWLLCAIVEDLLPASYYTPSLIGIRFFSVMTIYYFRIESCYFSFIVYRRPGGSASLATAFDEFPSFNGHFAT